MVGVGRDLCGSSSPKSCRSRVKAELAAVTSGFNVKGGGGGGSCLRNGDFGLGKQKS